MDYMVSRMVFYKAQEIEPQEICHNSSDWLYSHRQWQVVVMPPEAHIVQYASSSMLFPACVLLATSTLTNAATRVWLLPAFA